MYRMATDAVSAGLQPNQRQVSYRFQGYLLLDFQVEGCLDEESRVSDAELPLFRRVDVVGMVNVELEQLAIR